MDADLSPTRETLDKLQSLVDHFQSRKQRAEQRLKGGQSGRWHFALLGFGANFNEKSLGPLGVIREVTEPPGEIELAGALKHAHQFGAIGRYSSAISYELSVTPFDADDAQSAFNLGWWIISAIRTKTLAEFLVPAVADHSWSTIAGVTGNKCIAQFVEDVPGARRLDAPMVIKEEDIDWVIDNVARFAALLETPRFRLAVEAMTTHQHVVSPRMMVASIWSGIEALLDVKSELRYRLSLLTAVLLEVPGPNRVACYRRTKKLYDFRSKAVHGEALKDEELISHVVEARRILQRLLCPMVEHGKVPTEDDFEARLLGGD